MIKNKHLSQTELLERLEREGAFVSIYLVNGIKLQGVISGSDDYVIILKSTISHQMIYKHAISTIMST